jgi:hemolysin III
MQDRWESFADVGVQGTGLVLALFGSLILLHLTVAARDGLAVAAIAIYGVSLLVMFVCSILNAITGQPHRKAVTLALDHAAIYLLIAGTYTPFCLLVIGGTLGWWLLLGVWLASLAGMFVRVLFRRSIVQARVILYVLLGWSGLVAFRAIITHLPPLGSELLLAGGLIYTLGAPLHRWKGLRYHSALWHGCVLCAACLHYAALVLAVTQPA